VINNRNHYVFINSLVTGGAERVVTNLARYDKNLKIILIWNIINFDVPHEQIFFLLDKKGFLPFDLLIAFFKLLKFIKKNNVSAINSHLFWSNYINVFASLFTKHNTICTHCVSFKAKFEVSFKKYIFHYCLLKFLFLKSTNNTFKSKALMCEYSKLFKFDNGVVIYNPLDIEYISKKSLEYDLNISSHSVLIVGRFHSTKGQASILRAIPHINERIKFIFLGDGPNFGTCKLLAKELGISQRVLFVGNVDNPYPYYKFCKFYLSNSSAEGFPNSLIEAIYFECYPIHSDCLTGPREIITNFSSYLPVSFSSQEDFHIHQLGILFPTDSIQSMVESIKFSFESNLSLDVHLSKQLLKRLDINSINIQYSSLFDNAISEKEFESI
jgi:glycosyltransferase involved in cell wall biosynthesis